MKFQTFLMRKPARLGVATLFVSAGLLLAGNALAAAPEARQPIHER